MNSLKRNPLEPLNTRSIFRFFPDLLSAFVKQGELREASTLETVAHYRKPIEGLIIPLDGRLRLTLPSGRPGDETTVGFLDPLLPLSLRDMMLAGSYGVSATAEEDLLYLFVPTAVVKRVLPVRSDVEHAVQLMVSSPGLRKFLDAAIAMGVPWQNLSSLFKHIELRSVRVKRSGSLPFSKDIIFLLDDGIVRVDFLSAITTPQSIPFAQILRGGDWFSAPGSAETPGGPVSVKIVSDASMHAIPIKEIKKLVDKKRLEQLLNYHLDFDDDDVSQGELQQTAVKKVDPAIILRSLRNVGYSVDSGKVHIASSPRNWAETTVNNLAALHGVETNVSNIREYFSGSGGCSLGQLAEVLERHGFITRAFRCRTSKLSRQLAPFIVVFKSRPLVALRVDSTSIDLLDPSRGVVSLPLKDFRKGWSGQGLEARQSPLERICIDAENRRYINDNARISNALVDKMFHRDVDPVYLNLFALGSMIVWLQAMVPILMKYAVDKVLAVKSLAAVGTIGWALVLVVFFVSICVGMRKFLLEKKFLSQQFKVKSFVLRQLLQIAPTTPGEGRSYLLRDRFTAVKIMNSAFLAFKSELRLAVLSTVGYFLCVMFLCWEVSVILGIGLALIGGIKRFFISQRLERLFGLKRMRTTAKVMVGEQVDSLAQIKCANSERKFADRTERAHFDLIRFRNKLSSSVINGWGAADLGTGIVYSGAIFICINKGINSGLTPGVFLAVMMYLQLCIKSMEKLSIAYSEKQSFMAESLGLKQFVDPSLEYSNRYIKQTKAHALKGKIRFERVSYKYESTNNFSLAELNFTIEPGKVVAIVGQSGAGKSTLARLISGQLQQQSGVVLYDDLDSRLLSKFSVRDQIGVVSQSPEIFTDTVAGNIAFGDDAPNMERVRAAARAAGAHSFIEDLPGTYHCQMNNNGADLSAGQRTLLSIARVLYKDPRILIIDEAGANLDPILFKGLSDQLAELMADRTVIFVTQRLATLQRVDQVFVLKNGTLVEEGTHNDLMKNNREYVELFRAQVSSY